jgi:hypothetical protein
MSENNWGELQNIVPSSTIQSSYSNVSQSTYTGSNQRISTSLDDIIQHQSNLIVTDPEPTIFQEIESNIKNFRKNVFEDVSEYSIPTKIKEFNEQYSIEERLQQLELERTQDLPQKDKETIECLHEELDFNIEDCLSNIKKLKQSIISHFSNLKTAEEELEKEVNIVDNSFKHIEQLHTFSNGIQSSDLKDIFDKNVQNIYDNIIQLSKIKSLYDNYTIILKKHRFFMKCLQELKTLSMKPTCPFCLTQEIDTVIVSCGHTCCNQCVMQLGDRCGACRTKITKIQRLYII